MRKAFLLALSIAALVPAAVATQIPHTQRIEEVIAKVEGRRLRSDDHNPWVLVHGVIAFGKDATVYDAEAEEEVEIIDYLLTRAEYKDQRLFRVVNDMPALPREKAVEHHDNQFLMILALSGVPPDSELIAETGETFRVADLIEAAKLGYDDEDEVGWTLVALSTYLSFDDRWTAANGRVYSIEDIVREGVKRDPRAEAEGGTHHLFGVAYALRAYSHDHEVRGGTWHEAEKYLKKYTKMTRNFQQDDGAFSGKLLAQSAPPESPSDLVFTTGHTLEWLSLALTPKELEKRWIVRAVDRLCDEIERHPVESLSDGGLYHAVNALRFYRKGLSGQVAVTE